MKINKPAAKTDPQQGAPSQPHNPGTLTPSELERLKQRGKELNAYGRKAFPPWTVYEDAARRVLADIRKVLGIGTVEGKQTLKGASGTTWELDATAYREGSDGFLVIEARRHTGAGLKQEELAAIAYRIQDVGGSGGIVVSPLRMQKGARIVAASADIAHVRLSQESTTESYLAEFMGRRFLGDTVTESLHATDTCDAEVIRGKPNGT
jgi:hypothetical protein